MSSPFKNYNVEHIVTLLQPFFTGGVGNCHFYREFGERKNWSAHARTLQKMCYTLYKQRKQEVGHPMIYIERQFTWYLYFKSLDLEEFTVNFWI